MRLTISYKLDVSQLRDLVLSTTSHPEVFVLSRLVAQICD
jgi:hypothetical protein